MFATLSAFKPYDFEALIYTENSKKTLLLLKSSK
jgi:hypothetical protein